MNPRAELETKPGRIVAAKQSKVWTSKKTRKSRKKWKLSHTVFILPALLLNITFFIYPLLQSFTMSFFKWPIIGNKTFIGITNYLNLAKDATFWKTVWFTTKYTLLVTPTLLFLGLGLALLINNRLKGTSFFRAVYFMPVIISMVSASLMWLWIYNDLYGLFNYYLMQLNIIDKPVTWMGQASTSLPAIVFMITWKMAGFTMVILLAGLQGISDEVYEAAKVDGANTWQQIRYITLPLLKPSIGLSLVISVIGSVLAFEQFLIMTNGGPYSTTTTVVHHIYNTSFKYFNFGYGSAMTIVLLLILMILSVFQMRLMRNPEG